MAQKNTSSKKAQTKQFTTPVTGEEKAKALETAIKEIEKDFGKGSIMKMGENKHMDVQTVSTGSLTLDLALGVGGLPKGRIVEIYGPESSGKTTLALHCVAEVQKKGGTAAYIDAENALDPVYAKNLGVDIDSMLVSQPDSGEAALEICDALVSSGAVDIVVVDSVAALVPQQEIDGVMGQAFVGVQARLMSQALRKLSGTISKTNTIVIFINQLRDKVGVMYGNPETTAGGKALKYYASVRLDIRKGEPIKNGQTVIGNHTKCKVVKNKVAPPFKVAEFDIIYGKGIDKGSEIMDMAVDLGIIEKSGAWFSYNGNRLAQGKENSRALLEANPELMQEIIDQITKNDLSSQLTDSDDDDDENKAEDSEDSLEEADEGEIDSLLNLDEE